MIGRHGRWFVPLGPWTCRWKKNKTRRPRNRSFGPVVSHVCAHLWRAGRDVTSRFPKDTNGALSMDTNGGGDEVDSLTILGCRRWADGGRRGGGEGRGNDGRVVGRTQQ
jgi:hypothetical protein